MSSEALPISPGRFAEAIRDLPLASLHLKVLELRNSIAHLDYSNEQLRPFAEGVAPSFGQDPAVPSVPDRDCADAIAENETVIARMAERVRLVRAEVERRGCSWAEFEESPAKEEEEEEEGAGSTAADAETTTPAAAAPAVNGTAAAPRAPADTSGLSEAWRDGTIQMGVIRNGQIHMDGDAPPPAAARPSAGGSLTDEQLRRALEERMRLAQEEGQDDTDGAGLHL
ncbi:hypothetical protein GGTG_10123 [Gaeumannomyces tritici R3-111a-1]|uniref:Secondary alcohol dehydrogenase n=1 Tax=Gaeumannomyces tritici (strain R3-111a-1) TaxID=644352 RepID=J3P9E1_GAET3|nr:hypothetical protein GGTG_10123 [Gaeumannomyces tritici R3-111a-1]EJT73277.1 hypothetical protein GGTG_10123 [Gaeumannomyces tritici R3-111a-1]